VKNNIKEIYSGLFNPSEILTCSMPNNYFRFKQLRFFQDRCSFKVGTDGVLLGAYADITGATKILDIGTGSGIIALMLARRSDAEIVAIEPDNESFEQACSNFRISSWGSRIKAENVDLAKL